MRKYYKENKNVAFLIYLKTKKERNNRVNTTGLRGILKGKSKEIKIMKKMNLKIQQMKRKACLNI